MNMNIQRLDGPNLKRQLPIQFTPFRSGLAGQAEKHAQALERWIEENLSIKCSYEGVQDGTVFFRETR